MRNRYYDTARLYAPTFHSKDSPLQVEAADSRGGKAAHEKPSNGGPSTKAGEKSAENEPSQEQVYIIDDSSNAINDDDDDDSQLKYVYSLYKNRLSNNF